MKLRYKILAILFLSSFFACVEDKPLEPSPKLGLSLVEPSETYVGDEATLRGLAFGSAGDNSLILIDDTIKISSASCISWTPAKIVFTVPNLTGDRKIKVVIGKDTTSSVTLKIQLLPDFPTVEIPAGKITMGSNQGFMDEKPVTDITISKPFICFTKEVNRRLYSSVTGVKFAKDSLDFPIYNISWRESIDFCNALSAMQSLTPFYKISGDTVKIDTNSKGWRLPTEAEWEYACLGGTTTSPDWSLIAWTAENSGGMPHICGLKQANGFGLYDMLGNVWEWCWDFYAQDYYQSRPTKDPMGPDSGSRHVARGGSYEDGKIYARPSNRIMNSLNPVIGFRLVRNK